MNKKRIIFLSTLFILFTTIFFFQNEYVISEFYKEHYYKLVGIYPKEPVKAKIKTPSILTFNNLTNLSKGKVHKGLQNKLKKQLSTAYYVDSIYHKETKKLERPFIRVGHWNIERGKNIDVINSVIKSPGWYYEVYKKNISLKKQKELKKEIYNFRSVDVISLNEVDIGMPRTNYRNTVREIARSLKWNYAFAPEFVELSPIVEGKRVDPKKYKGLHGNAIISRFPIISTKVVRLPKCYNWYENEVKSKSPVEFARRLSAKTIFNIKIPNREIRRGGRNALVAEILLPNKEIVTVVSTHLEDRCQSKGRLVQARALLKSVKNVKGALVIAGDFNTSAEDSSPTSVTKEITKRIKDPHFLARNAITLAVPGLPAGVGAASIILSKVFQFQDPIAPSIPILFPNKERRLFTQLKKFKFDDGGAFDFSGDKRHSINGKSGLLANSNERHIKGFESTYEFKRPLLVAYFKLDWFFVKPKGNKYKPFHGQTLKLLNEAYQDKIADHDPLIVDISV